MYLNVYICKYVYMYTCIYGYIYIYKCINVYMYICIYVYMYICIYVYMFMKLNLYMYKYILHWSISTQIYVSKIWNQSVLHATKFYLVICHRYFFGLCL